MRSRLPTHRAVELRDGWGTTARNLMGDPTKRSPHFLLHHSDSLNGKFILDAAAVLHRRERFLRFKGLKSEEQAADNAGEAGDEQEKPDLRESVPSDEECGTEAAGRVHAHAGDANSEDVDGHERDADGEACEACGRGFLCRSENHDDED